MESEIIEAFLVVYLLGHNQRAEAGYYVKQL